MIKFINSVKIFLLLLLCLTQVKLRAWDADLYLVNFDSSQEEKIRETIRLMKKVILSDEFKKRIINYEFKGERKFHHNKGLSNEEIYQKILDGAEMLGKTHKNKMMDVELELYYDKSNIIGHTYPNTTRIWMNTKYFNKYTPVKVADNLMHEWMHKLGFDHEDTWTKDREHSVPYAVGYLVEELASKIAKSQTILNILERPKLKSPL